MKILGIFLSNGRISVVGCKRDFVFLCSRKHHTYVVDESCVTNVFIYSNVQYTEAGLETACTKMLSVC